MPVTLGNVGDVLTCMGQNSQAVWGAPCAYYVYSTINIPARTIINGGRTTLWTIPLTTNGFWYNGFQNGFPTYSGGKMWCVISYSVTVGGINVSNATQWLAYSYIYVGNVIVSTQILTANNGSLAGSTYRMVQAFDVSSSTTTSPSSIRIDLSVPSGANNLTVYGTTSPVEISLINNYVTL